MCAAAVLLLQIRRYVYCDVVRATDMSPHVDISGIQVGTSAAACICVRTCQEMLCCWRWWLRPPSRVCLQHLGGEQQQKQHTDTMQCACAWCAL